MTNVAFGQVSTNNFFNFETAPVRPLAISADHTRMAVCNLPKGQVEIFDITGPSPLGVACIPVGIDPVALSFRTTNELWVANYISSSISIIDLSTFRVFNTVVTSNQPSDIVFAGNPQRAYVSCALPNLVQVFSIAPLTLVTNLAIDGNRPKSLAVSPDGLTVYAAIFESGNASTIIGSGVSGLGNLPKPNAVSFPTAPSGGLNPPPNFGTNFLPVPNPADSAAPHTGLIVKKNKSGRWLDDNLGDWTEYIRGSNAAFTGRIPDWDLPDHDLAVIHTTNFAINYASGVMNICMAAAVNPATGKISVVGTDASNEIRYQPVLQSVFIRVNLAQVDPIALTNQVGDLNSHLDYQSRQVASNFVHLSIGDPRGMVWNASGSRAYISGMGSDNIVIVDANGARIGGNATIDVGSGPTGLALDENRQRLYVYNRFDNSISTIDTGSGQVINTLPLFDPTPLAIKAGRPHLYNTHQTSGLGQLACASCHVDARFDRLAWDLGDPTNIMEVITPSFNFANFVTSPTNNFHPMKGPMVTLTLQNIIAHEPFHWRGDREGIEAFVPTFSDLQGMPGTFSTNQMAELKGFLATIGFGPNPYRPIDNSLPTNLFLAGQFALGRGTLTNGAPLPNGNAASGQTTYRIPTGTGCIVCHTLPTGLGTDSQFVSGSWHALALSTNGSHHTAMIELARSSNLPFKIPSLRNLTDKLGMSLNATNNRAGFGFFNDGSVDGLVRFVQDGFSITNDQATADMIAFLYAFSGSDLIPGVATDVNRSPGVPSLDTQAGVGHQLTISNSAVNATLTIFINLAAATSNRMELIATGTLNGVARNWLLNATNLIFQSDRASESLSPASLRLLAAPGSEQTYTLVPKGSGARLSIDRDLDGILDGDLLIKSITATSSGPTIFFTSVIGQTYQVQFKTNLADASWNTAANARAGTGEAISLTDSSYTNSARYYRITTLQH